MLLLGVAVYFAADAEFRQQRDQAISAEVADLLREGGGPELRSELAERRGTRATGGFMYALFDPGGSRVAGTLDTAMPAPGFSMIMFNDPKEGPDVARADTRVLADGTRLVVAVDSESVEAIDATILTLFGAVFVAMLAIGLVGALLLGRYLRRRLDAITATANDIMAGDLAQRMPVGGNGDEFDSVASALNAMLDRIAGLMENLRQVSSDVAHDLRTPLLRLRGQLELVGHVDGAAQKSIELGDELMRLFASILRIAEVEGGGIERQFQPVDLSLLTEDVAETFLPAMADSGRSLEWIISPNVRVLGDRELLAQAIANLLDNARIHTPSGTAVDLRLYADQTNVLLSVSDDGPGVPAEDRAKILRRFFRGEASRSTPGNGLGLSLVGAVARSHGGEVRIGDSAPGLCVTIELPRLQ
ncbi:HAMP domain-containing sensor histidine kinase [Sphingomonas sp.]|uniref:HAMP domain-containing sensor histidine kinase n=1 Tax=Sphingomonas sp. TaxID=28214 RepID=UPI00345A966C